MGSVAATYDVNADVGEGFPYDDELLGVITSANVACGFHAGDAATMRMVCRQAVERGVAIGAQVSYRDREGFGRRELQVPYADLVSGLDEQVETLSAVAADVGGSVSYLKPHGALYNRACWDAVQANAIAAVATRHGLPVLALPGSLLVARTQSTGGSALLEFFADRAYDAGGRLVARSVEGSVISDPAEVGARVHRFATSGLVMSIDGERIRVEADSICVHGDTPDAISVAIAVRDALERAGIQISSCS